LAEQVSGGRGWVVAVVATAVGLPVGLVAVAWIGLDGWGSYRDGQHLGRLLAEAWVTMLVLAVGSAALGAVVGHHGWLTGLVAWPVVALGLPSLVGASGLAAAASAVLIAAGSIGVAALGGLVGAGLRARALPATGLLLAATLAAIVALHVAGGWLTA
jgi:hypothetical protein